MDRIAITAILWLPPVPLCAQWFNVALHLDGWAGTPQRPRAAVVRLLGGQMGGRLHVRGADHWRRRTWLDKVGRPHSEQMRVEERFHRISKDLLEFTVTIDDPAIYTETWSPLKFRMKLLPDDFDPTEMMCSVSEYMQYNKQMGFGNPTATNGGK